MAKENKRLDALKSKVAELGTLKRNWDGYDAKPVEPKNLTSALEILEIIYGDKNYTPFIVPGQCGEVQIEWYTKTGHLNIHIKSTEITLDIYND